MIPQLTIDKESINTNWDTEDARENVVKIVSPASISNADGTITVPVHFAQDMWVGLKVFKGYSGVVKGDWEYGYCDTEDALVKYLKPYIEDPDQDYYVHVTLMSMDYEKYYKNGSYINKDGVDTNDDYWEWIEEHPEDENLQDYEGNWIHFTIHKLVKDVPGQQQEGEAHGA